MSNVIREVNDRDMAHIVEVGNEYFYVDSVDAFDTGFETMVFGMGILPGEGEEAEAIDWSDLYCEYYSSYEAMEIKHKYIINNLEEFL